MMHDPHIPDATLNAFVDDELDESERERILAASVTTPEIKQQICEIGALKSMVRHAYAHATPPQHMAAQPHKRVRHGVAACCLLVVGVLVGWYAHLFNQIGVNTAVTGKQNAAQLAVAALPERVLLHIDSDQPEKMKAGLQEAENLLKQAEQSHTPFKLALLANKSGLDLLRSDKSPYVEQIAVLQKNYSNFELLACKQTIDRLHNQGIDVHLVPGAQTSNTAIDTLATRLPAGWHYIKV